MRKVFMKSAAGFLAAAAILTAGSMTVKLQAEEAPISVCIITSSGVDDGSFNQDCYNGIKAFIEEHPDCTVTDIKETDYNELIPTVEKSAGDYDVFVLPGFNFAGIGDIAMNNPDKKFIVVDSTITDSEGNAVTLDNVYTMTFKEGGNYTGDFQDEAQGKVVGEALIAEGCDVIFVAAGASGNGVFTAAKEAEGVYVIGCDVDQFDDGVNGSGNIILTSALKVMHSNVTLQLEKIYDGSFSGEDALLGADTDSTGYVSEEGRQQLSEDALEKLAECSELLKSGEIVPASQGDFQGLK